MKPYIFIFAFLLLCVFVAKSEMDFYSSCQSKDGNYIYGRRSMCLSKDGRILGVL